MGKQKEEEEKKDRAALLLQERKKIIYNLVLLGAASFVVLIAVLTMAWFVNNTKVNGTNMSVIVQMPQGVQISLGRTSDVALNNPTDYLMLVTEEEAAASEGTLLQGTVHSPRVTGNDSLNDWSETVNFGNYYNIGKLFPASSDSGQHILFTPDSLPNGKYLENGARFFLASGKTDGDLKHYMKESFLVSNDPNSLMATVHPYGNGESKSEPFWSTYIPSASWYDTNDDGYYVDIPVWLRTNSATSVNLKVEGYVTKRNGTLASEDDLNHLYKAMRVALLDAQYNPVVGNDLDRKCNILSLKNATQFGSSEASILDSNNFTVTRDDNSQYENTELYGIRKYQDKLDENGGIWQPENYVQYNAYNGNDTVVVLPVATSGITGDWGEAQKLIIRIWLDGDDEDCYNSTAGQNWNIHLRFFE
ncbi:MAG: hypothetical protein E7295_14145 [Lachnospiraceae bacterium]|jgi:hypothetical protein|nr:hypothetical protein [Lachnospiraceae bacterium]